MSNAVLENEILRTLSFMEPMTLEYIFLDLDKEFLQHHHELNYQDLLNALGALVKTKKIKQIESNDQKKWIKLFPKRPWYKSLFR
jgi:hypothetical protein